MKSPYPFFFLLDRAHSAITDSGFLSQSSLCNGNGGGHSPTTSSSSAVAAASSGKSQSSGALHKLPGLTGLADKINLLNGHSYANSKVDPSREASKVSISKEGMIEMPGKGWRYVYVARYSYDPFQHSPNDSPEAELQVWPQKRFFSMLQESLTLQRTPPDNTYDNT